jgi:hypothetical protein
MSYADSLVTVGSNLVLRENRSSSRKDIVSKKPELPFKRQKVLVVSLYAAGYLGVDWKRHGPW